MERGATSNTILIGISAAIALLVIVSIFFALQPPTQFDPESPQGAIQGYFQAVDDGDIDLAKTYLTDDLRQSCGRHEWYDDYESASRVVIIDTEIDGEMAKVRVDITISYGDDPFGGGSYDEDETITLVHPGDAWLISTPIWPMDRYGCNEGGN